MGIVETPLYDNVMTYIVAMKTRDGVLMASDGRVENRSEDLKVLGTDYRTQKLHDLTDNLVVGFAGAVSLNMDDYIETLKVSIEKYRPKLALEVVEFVVTASLRGFDRIMKRHSSGLEMLFGGFDVTDKGRLNNPRIYLATDEAGDKVLDVNDGWHDIGFIDGGRQVLLAEYEQTHKGYTKLKKLAVKAVRASAAKNPDAVGGNIYLKHITKNGIFSEVVEYNKTNE